MAVLTAIKFLSLSALAAAFCISKVLADALADELPAFCASKAATDELADELADGTHPSPSGSPGEPGGTTSPGSQDIWLAEES